MSRRKSSSSSRRRSTTRRRRSSRSLTSILLSELRRRFTRSTGIPTTRAGAERKLGALLISFIIGLFTRKAKGEKTAKSGSSARTNEQAARQDIDSQLDARTSHTTPYAEAAEAAQADNGKADIDDILNINPPD